MMFKKIILTLMALLFISSLAFGDVTVKDLGDGQAEITFTYQDNEAPEMNVIGSFNSWLEPGDAMVKNAAGLWEYKLVSFADDEIIYKFFDGTYISDANAPDEKDDGFAGMNGLIIVADLLLEAPVAPATDGTISNAPVKKTRKKSTFGTETYIESDTRFSTVDDDLKAVDSVVNAKSVWKFDGDLTANMPGYLEITFFDGSPTVWSDYEDDDPTTDGVTLPDGMETLASGFIFNPIYYFGGNERPALDKFRFGFNTKYLNYNTGYANSTLPGHDSVLWETIDKDETVADGGIAAGDGYSSFNTVVNLEGIDLNIDTTVVPNSVGENYGLFAIVNSTKGPFRADIQYEMESGTSDDFQKMFSNIPRQNIILGLGYNSSPIAVNAQLLNSYYIKGLANMKGPAEDRLAAAVKVAYTKEEDLGLSLEYKIRGLVAKMLYADNDSVLGTEDTQTVDLGTFYKISNQITPRLDVTAVLANEDTFSSNISLTFKPGTKFDFTEKMGKTTTGDVYVNIGMNTDAAEDEQDISFVVGATTTVDSITLNYGYDGSDEDITFNSLLLKAALKNDFTAELGLGLRDGDDVINEFGFSVGASWKLPTPRAKEPLLYCNFVYNIDPYETGSTGALLGDSNDYHLSNISDGEAAIRLGIVWNY